MAGGTIAELGWGVVGPQRVARTSGLLRSAIYRVALASKALAVIPAAVVAAMVAAFLVQNNRLDAAMIAAGWVMTALTPAWFFIGEGRPLRVLASESFPKVLINVGAAVAILAGSPLIAYSSATLLSPILTLFLAGLFVGGAAIPRMRDLRNAPRVIRRQIVIVIGRALSVTYTSLPVALLGAFVPSAVPAFAAVDRLMRMSLNVLSGVPSRLQSWVGGAPDKVARRARSDRSFILNVVLGVTCGVGFAVLSPFVAHLLFVGTVQVDVTLAALSGALLCLICVTRGAGLSLVAAGGANYITRGIALSAIVGTACIVPLAVWLGPSGAVIGEMLAELLGIGAQLYFLRVIRRRG
jgi:hypothetical protein